MRTSHIGRLALVLVCAASAFLSAADATISSDELELQNNGARTIFRGHVILKQSPYEIHADQMVRTKADANVDATGHVIGNWVSAKGKRLRVESEVARYVPSQNTVEVWGHSQVAVFVSGQNGEATLHGDRGWVYTQTPGRAKLSGRVTGHIVPAGTQ